MTWLLSLFGVLRNWKSVIIQLGMSERNYRTGKRSRIAPEVMRKPELHILHLALAGFPLQLVIYLIKHSQAACADRVAEGLQPAVSVNGPVALQRERARVNVDLCLAPL